MFPVEEKSSRVDLVFILKFFSFWQHFGGELVIYLNLGLHIYKDLSNSCSLIFFFNGEDV